MNVTYRKYVRGFSLVYWLVALVPILGIGAFAVDLNNILGSKGHLQSASDAGALEAARLLYCPNNPMALNKTGCGGTLTPVLDAGEDAATKNLNANQIELDNVEIITELGHWQFVSSDVVDGIVRGGVFTPHDFASATAQPLVGADGQFRPFVGDPGDDPLNDDLDEINAVRMIIKRTDMAMYNFFLNIIYGQDFSIEASAVAYLGFAGRVEHDSVDAPIALCIDKLPECGYGSFIASDPTTDTGIWTNLTAAVDQCISANANTVRDLISNGCRQSGMNPADLELGSQLGIISGTVSSASSRLRECWMDNGVLPIDNPGVIPTTAWRVMIPVLDCLASGQCKPLLGVMEADIVWFSANNQSCRLDNLPVTMTRTDADGNILTWNRPTRNPGESDADYALRVWSNSVPTLGFADFFNLKVPPASGPWSAATDAPCDGSNTNYIYFVPVCAEGTPTGGFGGAHFGIRAEESVLVY